MSIVSYQTAFANSTCAWAHTYAARYGLNVSYTGSYGAPSGGLAGNWTPTVAAVVDKVCTQTVHLVLEHAIYFLLDDLISFNMHSPFRRQLVSARGDVLILCPDDLPDGVEFAKQLYADTRHQHKALFVKTAPVEQSEWNAATGSAGDWVFVPVQWDKDEVLPYVKLPSAPFDSPLSISNEFQSRFGREPTFFGIRALNSLLTLYSAMGQAATIDTHPLIVSLVRMQSICMRCYIIIIGYLCTISFTPVTRMCLSLLPSFA